MTYVFGGILAQSDALLTPALTPLDIWGPGGKEIRVIFSKFFFEKFTTTRRKHRPKKNPG